MLQNDNVWLNSNAISNLFTVDRTVITKYIYIYIIFIKKNLKIISHVQKLHIWVIMII